MSSDTLEYWYGITPEMLKSMNKGNTKQSEETKIQWSMTGNPVLSGQSITEAILTIHPDGRVTTSDRLKPDETAALVLDQIKTQWLKDAQATKIRELQDRIKRLEQAGDEMADLLEGKAVTWTKAKRTNHERHS